MRRAWWVLWVVASAACDDGGADSGPGGGGGADQMILAPADGGPDRAVAPVDMSSDAARPDAARPDAVPPDAAPPDAAPPDAMACATEQCDGLDDDCDGVIDEGAAGGPLRSPCYDGPADALGVGVCVGGVSLCTGGAFGACGGAVLPRDEACNGLDDDCDGAIDEVAGGCACIAGQVAACYSGPPETLGVGACVGGRQGCVDGAFGACEGEVTPAGERCDGRDDDCDGAVDEGFDVDAPCAVGLGACAAEGTRICAEDGSGAPCDAAPGVPSAELCNGIDDDCDGMTDEDFPTLGDACAVGDGACLADGLVGCDARGAAACDAAPGVPSDELCNAIDDDCDGMTDEDFPALGDPCAAGLGACARPGFVGCTEAGDAACDAIAGEPRPEQCDELDDDCDGAVDEVPECVVPECGNGVVEPGELCDGGPECRACASWTVFRESERNDSVATANDAGAHRRISADTSASGVGCCGRPDTDMFRVRIDAPSSVSAYCRAGIGCLGWTSPYTCHSMALLDENGAVVGSNAGSHPEYRCAYIDPERDPALGRVEPGVYYVRVTHSYINGQVDPVPPGRYSLELEYGEPTPAP